MKRMSKLLATAVLGLIATFSVSANPWKICNDNVEVKVISLAPCDDDDSQFVVNYETTIYPNAISKCESLILTPVVKNGDNKHIFEVLVINGNGRKGIQNKWLANEIYNVCDPNYVRVFTIKEGETLKIKSSYTLPWAEWMDGAKFAWTSQKATYSPNCIKAYPGEEEVCGVPHYDNPYEIAPNFVETTPDAIGEHHVKTRLYYPVNVTRSVDSYFENAQALTILNNINKENFEVTKIVIDGWASPEATVPYNNNLSINRAKTMKKIIKDKYGWDESLFTTTGKGEFWDYAIDYINNTSEPVVAENRDALQQAVTNNSDLDKREAAIKKIAGGKPYKAIFDATYPRSRFSDCEVWFKALTFDADAMKAIYEADPEQIDAVEYAALAAIEPNAELLADALKYYPNDETINAVAGQQALAAGDVDKAIKYFEKAGDSEENMNNLGGCWLIKGDVDKAVSYYEKAGNLAAKNAKEVKHQKINNKYFGK